MSRDPSKIADMVDCLYVYATTTPSREPLSDWHHVKTGVAAGFTARSVVGAIFMQLRILDAVLSVK